MIYKVTQSMFCDAFYLTEKQDHFSYAGKIALFNWLEDLESSAGEQIELDVVDLCCSFAEYANLEDYNNEFNHGDSDKNVTITDIQSWTTVIPIGETESFIIQQF